MISTFEAYLITRGDTLHSMMGTLTIMFIVLTAIAFIAAVVYIRVFDENNNANDDDTKSALASVKLAVTGVLLVVIIQGVKTFTPRSEDMLIIAGLREITTEDLMNTSPMTNEVLKKRFPDVAIGLTESQIRINELKSVIEYKNVIIDSISTELNIYKNDSNIVRLR